MRAVPAALMAALLAGTPAGLRAAALPAPAPSLAADPVAAPATPTLVNAAQDAVARVTVPVMVNGQGPFRFVVDTGADRTVISSALARLLRLPSGRPVRLHDIAGVAEVPTVLLDRLAVGGRELPGLQAPLLEEANLGAAGLLGIDSLRDQRVTMDFRAHTFMTAASAGDDEPGTIVVYGRSKFGQLVLVNAEADGQRICVILDTGAQNTLGNSALQHLMSAAAARRPPDNDVIGVTGGSTPSRSNTIEAIKLGGFELHDVPVAYADLETFRLFGLRDRPAMLLGMDVLRLFSSVSVDFARRKAAFLPR